MQMCLAHPSLGYYRRRDPLGKAGDFTTAPEISQMFGEMIGIWCAHMWTELGRPDPFLMVELGPGRGTLMADLLRAAGKQPGFLNACRVHLVETSPTLRTKQRDTLSAHVDYTVWHDDLAQVPSGATLLVANEFLDALPVHQLILTASGWRARVIDAKGGALCWSTAEQDMEHHVPASLRDAAPESIFEWAPARADMAALIAGRLRAAPGAALLIDYGFSGPRLGDSFQALSRHEFTDPLANPGDADLTSHVDFSALGDAARAGNAQVYGPISQASFLDNMGIGIRAQILGKARPDKVPEIELALARLIAPEQMGALFQVLALTSAGLPPPPPFSEH